MKEENFIDIKEVAQGFLGRRGLKILETGFGSCEPPFTFVAEGEHGEIRFIDAAFAAPEELANPTVEEDLEPRFGKAMCEWLYEHGGNEDKRYICDKVVVSLLDDGNGAVRWHRNVFAKGAHARKEGYESAIDGAVKVIEGMLEDEELDRVVKDALFRVRLRIMALGFDNVQVM